MSSQTILPSPEFFENWLKTVDIPILGLTTDLVSKLTGLVSEEAKNRNLIYTTGSYNRPAWEKYSPIVITLVRVSKTGKRPRRGALWHIKGNSDCIYLQNLKKKHYEYPRDARGLVNFYNDMERGWETLHEVCKYEIIREAFRHAKQDYHKCIFCDTETYKYISYRQELYEKFSEGQKKERDESAYPRQHLYPLCGACSHKHDFMGQSHHRYKWSGTE